MDPEEYVLRHIFGARPVLNRPANDGEDQVFILLDQVLKGPFVTAAAALDELALVDKVHSLHRAGAPSPARVLGVRASQQLRATRHCIRTRGQSNCFKSAGVTRVKQFRIRSSLMVRGETSGG